MLKAPEELLRDLISADIVTSGEIEGCTETEIQELETVFKVSLPEPYKHFLRVMGKRNRPGDFYASYVVFDISDIELMKKSRKEVAEILPYYAYELKPTDFVCLYRDSTFCGFFDTTAGADPPVSIATEMEETVVFDAYPNFLSYLNYVVNTRIEWEQRQSQVQ